MNFDVDGAAAAANGTAGAMPVTTVAGLADCLAKIIFHLLSSMFLVLERGGGDMYIYEIKDFQENLLLRVQSQRFLHTLQFLRHIQAREALENSKMY